MIVASHVILLFRVAVVRRLAGTTVLAGASSLYASSAAWVNRTSAGYRTAWRPIRGDDLDFRQ
jgi:hypothetical protein